MCPWFQRQRRARARVAWHLTSTGGSSKPVSAQRLKALNPAAMVVCIKRFRLIWGRFGKFGGRMGGGAGTFNFTGAASKPFQQRLKAFDLGVPALEFRKFKQY